MYNPEKRAWRGRSYKKGGRNVRALREAFVGDEGSDPVDPPAEVVLPTFFVVEQTGSLSNPTVRRIEVEGQEAVATYDSLQRSWEYDDRLISIHIEDAEGRSFRPTADYSGICGVRYALPLVEITSNLADEPSDADLAEWYAREEERMDGLHKDSLYW